MTRRSLEVGDKPRYTDSMFNFVPGSCFEIGASLAMLDAPGSAGIIIDQYANQLASIIQKIYDFDYPDIRLSIDGPPTSLRDYFNKKILMELRPSSDQIGRCQDKSKSLNWLNGQGKDWLIEQLNIPSNSGEKYEYTNMLTKIRTISAFGTILREMQHFAKDTAAVLVEKDSAMIEKRYSQITEKIRHANFDDPKTRARTEKMPIVDGKPLSSYDGIIAKTIDAGMVGLGFGKVWHETGIKELAQTATVIKQYVGIENKYGRQGMPRLGQDINDSQRPGLLGESSLDKIPEAFNKLRDQLDAHKFEHGSGLNRWQLTGSYPKASWDQNMPAAGAHSGGTSDIFLALNCLGKDTIFGQRKASDLGLLISSFMNFGGYHSFVETFPISQAVAADVTFKVDVTTASRDLYQDIAAIAQTGVASIASQSVDANLKAYQATVHSIRSHKHSEAPYPKAVKHEDLGVLDIPGPVINSLAINELTIHTEQELVQCVARAGSLTKVTHPLPLGDMVGVEQSRQKIKNMQAVLKRGREDNKATFSPNQGDSFKMK